MSGFINVDALEQKLGKLGVSNAYDRPSFWYGKDKKDYKVIPTKYHNGYDNALADVEKAIQELPTIEELEERRWIPVTERLPDIGVPVLTFDGYVFLVEKRIEWIWGDNEKIYSEWWVQGYDADNENPIGLRDGAVTAWMPLPKPYEGSETE